MFYLPLSVPMKFRVAKLLRHPLEKQWKFQWQSVNYFVETKS
jgi:hypothetical protein